MPGAGTAPGGAGSLSMRNAAGPLWVLRTRRTGSFPALLQVASESVPAVRMHPTLTLKSSLPPRVVLLFTGILTLTLRRLSTSTQDSSSYLSWTMTPPSNIRILCPWQSSFYDSDSLQQFQNFDFEGTNCLIFDTDVKSLYTSIPHQDGLRALRFFLENRPEPSPPTTTVLHHAELILVSNNFTINSSHFLPWPWVHAIHIQRIIRHHFRHLQQDAITRLVPHSFCVSLHWDCSLQDTLVHSSSIP
eukprot:g32296.t1